MRQAADSSPANFDHLSDGAPVGSCRLGGAGTGLSLGPASLNTKWPVIVADLLSVAIEPAQEAINSALTASVGTRNPIEAASAIVAASLALCPDSRCGSPIRCLPGV